MHLPLFYKKNNFAFSVIELIVSASIIAIISVMVVANFRGSNQKEILRQEAERLSSVLREAHINSLIGQTVNGIRPVGGFGVRIGTCTPTPGTPCSYSIYADMDGDNTLEQNINTIKTYDANIMIMSVAPVPSLDIHFSPPKGDVFFTTDGTANVNTAKTATTTLSYVNSSYQIKVVIDRRSGKINVSN